jgi:hypothetical protein
MRRKNEEEEEREGCLLEGALIVCNFEVRIVVRSKDILWNITKKYQKERFENTQLPNIT